MEAIPEDLLSKTRDSFGTYRSDKFLFGSDNGRKDNDIPNYNPPPLLAFHSNIFLMPLSSLHIEIKIAAYDKIKLHIYQRFYGNNYFWKLLSTFIGPRSHLTPS